MWLVLAALVGCNGNQGADRCLSCHVGIEQAHGPIDARACVVCHGGDRTANSKEEAHVPVPDNYLSVRGTGLPAAPEGFIKDMPPNMLDQLDPAYVRFINPGDIRVVAQTCGVCHPEQVATMPNSIMTTNAGHYWPTRWYAGMQQREAVYGSTSATDPGFDGSPGTVASLEVLNPPNAAEIATALADPDSFAIESVAYDHYLAKNCNTCHAAGYPKNNSRGLYRSTGCSSCHVVYDIEGVYRGDDEAIPNNVPVYPAKHQITKAIPTEQCASCHFQGGRIGLLFRGIREGGFSDTPPNAEPWNESVYGHTPGYYILDEDTTNDVDETPPDVHYAAGMHCADCHIGREVHGDGRIYSSAKGQVDLRCEDCHGTVRDVATPDGEGVFRTSTGRPLTQLSTGEGGDVVLTGIVDGVLHTVPQPAAMLAVGGGASDAMRAAMAPDPGDWSHTDALTCDTCHTSYMQQCLGCHVSLDLRLSQVDYQTGLSTAGLTRGSREMVSIDDVVLCQATDGRAQRCASSQQVQMSVVDADGNLVLGEHRLDESGEPTGKFDGVFRDDGTFNRVIGWAPFFQHTTTAKPAGCETCHRTADTPAEHSRVRGVYGYGTGEFMLENPYGPDVDALGFLDADGNATTRFVHPGTGPLSAEARDRALGVELP